MFVPACHSGFLEGHYFSMMICTLFVRKNLRSLLNWRGGRIHGMLKEKQKEKDGDEEETRRSRGVDGRWRKKVGKADWGRRCREAVLYSLEKPPSDVRPVSAKQA